MKVIHTRNVHQVLPFALQALMAEGIKRDSRNGPVLQYPTPVTTVYHRPCERVLFWKQRDANPFFHLYESLWMLRGRNDVAGVAKYASQMNAYSDDKIILHGAYGARWRKWFKQQLGRFPFDQLTMIAEILNKNHHDRRCVLQMWDAPEDLGVNGLDVPCNTIATFQVNTQGTLDLSVFCRSNDIIWGAYGANAVHFSFLLEYMALWVGIPVGRLYQISINWHAYLNVLEKHKSIVLVEESESDPYMEDVQALRMVSGDLPIEEVDRRIEELVLQADCGFSLPYESNDDEPFFDAAYKVLRAHHIYKITKDPLQGITSLHTADQSVDWVRASLEWFQRRVK